MREFTATVVAAVVIILTGGNGPVGIVAWFAVFFIWPERSHAHMSAERRYRMRETERRNQSIQMWERTKDHLTKM